MRAAAPGLPRPRAHRHRGCGGGAPSRRVRLLPSPLPLRGVAPHVRANDGGRADAAGPDGQARAAPHDRPRYLHRLVDRRPLAGDGALEVALGERARRAGAGRIAVERDREDRTRCAAEHAATTAIRTPTTTSAIASSSDPDAKPRNISATAGTVPRSANSTPIDAVPTSCSPHF